MITGRPYNLKIKFTFVWVVHYPPPEAMNLEQRHMLKELYMCKNEMHPNVINVPVIENAVLSNQKLRDIVVSINYSASG